ncbi:MAG: hypothetical protein KDI68_09285 [Gammaproteobacteria bacterium]|nr:hypothetical protein [Gammaproteobacteria bacterium]
MLFPLAASFLVTACAGLEPKNRPSSMFDVNLDPECCEGFIMTPKPEATASGGTTPEPQQQPAEGRKRGTFNQNGQLLEPGTVGPQSVAMDAKGAIPTKGKPTDKLVLDYEQASLRGVIENLADALGINLLISIPIEGSVTFRTNPENPLMRRDIWPLFRLLLGNAGLNLVQHGDVFEVTAGVSGLDEIALQGTDSDSETSMTTQITPLRFVDATVAIDLLAPILNNGGGRATTANSINMLAITAPREGLTKINQLLRLVDVDPFRHRGIRLFYLQNTDAEQVAKELYSILKMIEGNEGTYQVHGLQRINALLVVSPPQRGFREVERWVDILDEAGSAQGEQMFVYRMKSLSAVSMAETLSEGFSLENGVTGKAGGNDQGDGDRNRVTRQSSSRVPGGETDSEKRTEPVQAAAPPAVIEIKRDGVVASEGVSANLNLTIVADEETNSLLVRATPRDYKQLLSTLSQLDKSPLEVVISVVIAQVTLNDATAFGIDWEAIYDTTNIISGSIPQAVNSFVGTGFGVPEGLTTTDGSAVGLVISNTSSDGDLKAVLNALATTNKVDVLSRPTILVKNNQEASIKVGSQQPVITAQKSADDSGATPVVSNDISYRDTGIELTVKPQINEEGIIQLEIDQSLSSIGQNSAVPGLPSFDNQQIQTVAVVADRSVIMLGGLIESTTINQEEYVPFLGAIPVVGAAFGTTTLSTVRRELVLMLMPEIVDPNGGEAFYKAFRKRVQYAASVLEDSFSGKPWKPMGVAEKAERILIRDK